MSAPLRAMVGLAASLILLSAAQVSSKKGTQKAPAQAPPPKPMGPAAPDPKSLAPPVTDKVKFVYSAEWRLIRAGTVTLESQPSNATMRIESAGLVASLFKVDDVYKAHYDESTCVTSTTLEAMEGKRHHETQVTYDPSANKAHHVEKDLATGMVLRDSTVDTPPCPVDTIGALLRLRGITAEPGRSVQIPISDGRRSAMVKIDAQEREEIKVAAGTFKTIRYEAALLNGVIYSRKGRVFAWYSDDAQHIPVQIRVRTNFPVGTVTLELEKQESH